MILKYPYGTEKSMEYAEKNNALQFVVDINATKTEIKNEIESLYDLKVYRVNTMITPTGKKKATIFFEDSNAAKDLASRLGVL